MRPLSKTSKGGQAGVASRDPYRIDWIEHRTSLGVACVLEGMSGLEAPGSTASRLCARNVGEHSVAAGGADDEGRSCEDIETMAGRLEGASARDGLSSIARQAVSPE